MRNVILYFLLSKKQFGLGNIERERECVWLSRKAWEELSHPGSPELIHATNIS